MTDELGRKIEKIELKIDQVEKDVQEMKINQAIRDTQFQALKSDIAALKTSLENGFGEFKKDRRWVMAALLSAFILPIVNFLLRGGLFLAGN